MTKKYRTILIASIALVGFLAGGTYLYSAWWMPNQKMRDRDWWANASEDEIRMTCHQVLRFPLGCYHDAFLSLAEIGNAESVPLLIRSLKWQEAPDETGFMVCTTGHAVEALQSLTGQDFGFEPERWRDWWQRSGSKMPPGTFHPRHRKESPTEASQEKI